MTVKELIKALQAYDDDAQVAAAIDGEYPGYPPAGLTGVSEDVIYDTWYVFLEVES